MPVPAKMTRAQSWGQVAVQASSASACSIQGRMSISHNCALAAARRSRAFVRSPARRYNRPMSS